MKKVKKVKIRDVGIDELLKYCDSQKDCKHCKFNKIPCMLGDTLCFIYNKELYNDKFLNQKIEIEE